MILEVLSEYLDINSNNKACCCFHAESTPSLSIKPDEEYFKCFGCGESGDAIKFVMLAEELPFKQALSRVAQIMGISPEEVMKEKNEQKVLARTKAALQPKMTRDELTSLWSFTGYESKGYRGIRDDITEFYGHRTSLDENGNVAARYYPETNKEGSLCGYKCRNHPKDFSYGKVGSTGNKSQLSGQAKFRAGGKYVLIVGGEEDKCAAYQMLLANQADKQMAGTPVVSPTSGEGSAKVQCVAQYEWLDQFEVIMIGLDNDKAGNIAALEVASVLPQHKVRIIKWTGKDPNQMLIDGQERQFVRDYWNAKPVINTGILNSTDTMDAVEEELRRPRLSLPPHMHKLATAIGFPGPQQGRIINIIGDTSVGKCQGKGTPILMHDGRTVNIEDIVVGDQVMGADGSPRNVLSICTGIDTMYKVEQQDGDDYTVNSKHVLSLRAGYECKASGVLKGDIVNVPVTDYIAYGPKLKRSLKGYKGDLTRLGEGAENAFEPFIIGLWLADGSATAPAITMNTLDVESIESVEACIARNGYKKSICPSRNTETYITMYLTGGFRTVLSDLNLLSNKHIPPTYKFGNYDTRIQVLSGIIAGDGYLHNGCYEVVQKSDQLTDDIVFVARSLGLRVRVTKEWAACQNFTGGWYNRILISGQLDKLDVKVKRKICGELSELRRLKNTTITVTNIGEGEYFGFSLDGDHLYCLKDFTVTHNSTHVNGLVYHWIFNAPEKVGVVSLEATAGQYGIDMLSLHLEQNLIWNRTGQETIDFLKTPAVKEQAETLWTDEHGEPRWALLDERDGDIKNLERQIERLVNQFGCKIIVIDVLTDILRGMPMDQQEEHMKWQKKTIKNGVTIVNVLHTRKPGQSADGKIRRVTEYDALGSGSFVQSAAINIVVIRDKMAVGPEKHITYFDLPKCRGGVTGENVMALYYDWNTRKVYDYDEYLMGAGQVPANAGSL